MPETNEDIKPFIHIGEALADVIANLSREVRK